MNKTKKQTLNPQLENTPVSGSRFVPMLFSTEMVQAILNSTKTETRRIVKFKKAYTYTLKSRFEKPEIQTLNNSQKPKVNVGDVIWVRETFNSNYNNTGFIYKADYKEPAKNKQFWKASLFMPKVASRMFLKVVSVHIERLQDIDEQSAINEGIEDFHLNTTFKGYCWKNYLFEVKKHGKICNAHISNTPIESYMTLWQKINGKDSHELNPFVWVYKFERIERPYDFCQRPWLYADNGK